MKLKIKICGLRDGENIREASALGPDLLGLIFYPGSKRFAGDLAGASIFTELPDSISAAGVFVNETTEKILQTAGKFSLDFIQLHGNESPSQCLEVRKHGLKVIKVFGLASAEDISRCSEYLSCADYLLFDTSSMTFGGTGRKFNWKLLENYTLRIPFFLSGGIGPDDAVSISEIDHPSFYGIDLNSRFEKEPGIKDITKLKKFIEKIREL